jgi:hypothetical protein
LEVGWSVPEQESDMRSMGRLNAVVTDTGIGIAPEFLDKLFLKFSQEKPSDTRISSGSGLGLFISHQLARLMGAELHYETQNVGSRFVFSCPIKIPDVQKPQCHPIAEHLPRKHGDVTARTTLKSKPQMPRLKCLVIDDDPMIRMVITRILSKWQCQVKAYEGADTVLESWKSGTSDVCDAHIILLDLQMPGISLA